MFNDNQTTIHLTMNQIYYNRRNHIDVKMHFMHYTKIPTFDNLTNVMKNSNIV